MAEWQRLQRFCQPARRLPPPDASALEAGTARRSAGRVRTSTAVQHGRAASSASVGAAPPPLQLLEPNQRCEACGSLGRGACSRWALVGLEAKREVNGWIVDTMPGWWCRGGLGVRPQALPQDAEMQIATGVLWILRCLFYSLVVRFSLTNEKFEDVEFVEHDLASLDYYEITTY